MPLDGKLKQTIKILDNALKQDKSPPPKQERDSSEFIELIPGHEKLISLIVETKKKLSEVTASPMTLLNDAVFDDTLDVLSGFINTLAGLMHKSENTAEHYDENGYSGLLSYERTSTDMTVTESSTISVFIEQTLCPLGLALHPLFTLFNLTSHSDKLTINEACRVTLHQACHQALEEKIENLLAVRSTLETDIKNAQVQRAKALGNHSRQSGTNASTDSPRGNFGSLFMM